MRRCCQRIRLHQRRDRQAIPPAPRAGCRERFLSRYRQPDHCFWTRRRGPTPSERRLTQVLPYPVGTVLPGNGLPVFTVNFENDDESQRKLGKDSRLTFVAPADGTYLVRVADVRGFAGEDFKYDLVVRRPQPDFKVTLSGANPTVNAGSGKQFSVKAERLDNFSGPIRIDITGLPPGFQASTPYRHSAGPL